MAGQALTHTPHTDIHTAKNSKHDQNNGHAPRSPKFGRTKETTTQPKSSTQDQNIGHTRYTCQNLEEEKKREQQQHNNNNKLQHDSQPFGSHLHSLPPPQHYYRMPTHHPKMTV
jgi:hypothetical protein